jgi:hypothetical protein
MDFAVSEDPVPLHTPQMREVAMSELAHQNALSTARALASTACELLAQPQLVVEAREEFARRSQALGR